MRVVIACCGLEHTKRGFEAYSRELFNALTGSVDVVLCKGSGKRRPNEVVIPCVRRDFLSGFMNPWQAFYWEQITFAISLVPYLMFKKVDIVHFSEGNVGNALARFKRWTGLLTGCYSRMGGLLIPSTSAPRFSSFKSAKTGRSSARVRHSRRAATPYSLRHRSGRVPIHADAGGLAPAIRFTGRWVCDPGPVSALLRSQETGLPNPRSCGDSGRQCFSLHGRTSDHRNSAAASTRGRTSSPPPQVSRLPRADVPELLAAADLFAHAAIAEGFGMVLLEACAAGVPVVCHDSPHFDGCWTSLLFMRICVSGELAARIQALMGDRNAMRRYGALGAERVETHYSWKVLFAPLP